MKQEYKTPKVEVIEFEGTDVICTSGELLPTPQIEVLHTDGALTGNTKMSDLLK